MVSHYPTHQIPAPLTVATLQGATLINGYTVIQVTLPRKAGLNQPESSRAIIVAYSSVEDRFMTAFVTNSSLRERKHSSRGDYCRHYGTALINAANLATSSGNTW